MSVIKIKKKLSRDYTHTHINAHLRPQAYVSSRIHFHLVAFNSLSQI